LNYSPYGIHPVNNNTLKRAHELLGENPFSRFLENESEIKFNRSLFDAWTFHLARLSEMQDREIALRFIAFQIVNSQDYNASMRIYLDKGLEELNKQLKVKNPDGIMRRV
jgi:hypothetical protein